LEEKKKVGHVLSRSEQDRIQGSSALPVPKGKRIANSAENVAYHPPRRKGSLVLGESRVSARRTIVSSPCPYVGKKGDQENNVVFWEKVRTHVGAFSPIGKGNDRAL